MSWTPEKKKHAAAERWELVDTIDGNNLMRRVFGINGLSNQAAQRLVLDAARGGSKFHIETLRLITHSIQPIKPGRKK